MGRRRKPGAFEEQDGATSMRRALAALYALSSLAWYVGAAFYGGGMPAFYSGLACSLAAIILLFFTTWSDLSAAMSAARGINVSGSPRTILPNSPDSIEGQGK